MSDANTLRDAVDAINEQATRKKTSENIDQMVQNADRSISNLNDEMDELADKVETLQFYRRLLDKMFDGGDPPNVQPALEEAELAVQVEQSKIVDYLISSVEDRSNKSIGKLRQDVSEATSTVDEAIESTKNRLRGYKKEWEDRIKSARELQRIIGGQNQDFEKTVDWLENIISEQMWDPTHYTVTGVVSNWNNATTKWENHQELQDLDSFRETHGLSEEAISAVDRLSSQSNLTLEEVDVEVLKELKRIDELADAVELSI